MEKTKVGGKTAFEEAVASIATETPATEVAGQTQSNALAQAGPVGTDFVGQIRSSDIQVPNLNIAQKVGPLSEMFQPGTVVLNKEKVVAETGASTFITVLNSRKQLQEDIPWGSDQRPRVFKDEASAEAAGLTTTWTSGGKPQVKDILDLTILVEAPEGMETDPVFHLTTPEGIKAAMAVWNIRSYSAYNSAGKSLLTTRTMYINSWPEQQWELVVTRQTLGANLVYVPDVTQHKTHSVEFQKWAKGLIQ